MKNDMEAELELAEAIFTALDKGVPVRMIDAILEAAYTVTGSRRLAK